MDVIEHSQTQAQTHPNTKQTFTCPYRDPNSKSLDLKVHEALDNGGLQNKSDVKHGNS